MRLMKRICAGVLCAAMTIPALVGCSSVKKATGITAGVKAMTSNQVYTATMEISAATEEMNISSTATIKSDGKATAVDFAVSTESFDFSIENCFVYTDDTAYVNVKGLVSQLASLATVVPMEDEGSVAQFNSVIQMAENMLGDNEWISFTCKGLFKKDNKLSDDMIASLEKYFADVVVKEGNEYKITLASAEDAKKLAGCIYKLLDENLENWMKDAVAASKDKSKVLLACASEYLDKVESSMGEDLGKLGVDLSEIKSQLETATSEIDGQIDESTEDISETVDEVLTSMKDSIDNMDASEETDETKIEIVTKIEGNQYNTSVSATGIENVSAKLSYEVEAGKCQGIPDGYKKAKDVVDFAKEIMDSFSGLINMMDAMGDN